VNRMKTIIAENAGFCFGVKRAVKIALDAAKHGKVYTLGALIHNPPMVKEMRSKGVIAVDDFKGLDNARVIIPSHGISPKVLKEIKSEVKEIIDATCPFVKIAREEAVKLGRECGHLIIVGDKTHPEIRGILPFLGVNVMAVKDASELTSQSFTSCGVVAQTTMSEAIFEQVVAKLKNCSGSVKVVNTICDATRRRQDSTLKLLKGVDIMIVIGGHNSANTRRLLELCLRKGKTAYQVEDVDELRAEWFKDCKKVGITAGASTPRWMIKKIKDKISSF
jgi:(E)-4-hydroxy-3-methyl-but-2-enyl pyrophosphate reductase